MEEPLKNFGFDDIFVLVAEYFSGEFEIVDDLCGGRSY